MGALNPSFEGDIPAPRAARYGSLDLWRGVACLCIVVYHSTILHVPEPVAVRSASAEGDTIFHAIAVGLIAATRQLWIGVPLFFVISVYCIAASADSTRRKATCAKTFFMRRFRRIYPPYWIVVAITVVFVALVDVVIAPGLMSSVPWPQYRPWWLDWSQWVGNMTLTETWRHYLFGSPRGHFVGQSWTLCYEEQFYAVIGLLLVLTRRRLFPAVAIVTIISIAIQFAAAACEIPVQGFFFDGYWLQFAAGVVVYYGINYATPWRQRMLVALLCAACALSLIARHHAAPGSVAAFAFAMALFAMHPWDQKICSWRPLRPLFLCGTICYSMYLIHEPLVRALSRWLYSVGPRSDAFALCAGIPVSIAISIFSGWACYVAIERRFVNAPHFPRTPSDEPAPELGARFQILDGKDDLVKFKIEPA